MPRPTILLALVALSAAVVSQERVTIDQVPELARARSERQRPAQLALLEPFLADLRSDYRRNASVLDETFDKVAALGDGIVPLLIEFLTPTNPGDNRQRWLADNAGRVLARLDPAAHSGTWIELADGDHRLGRRQAIQLLGRSDRTPRVVTAMVRAYPRLTESYERVIALRAATRLETPALTALATDDLGSLEAELRAAVLDYLTRFEAADAVPRALETLRRETERALLGRYIEFFRKVVSADQQVADALVPLIEGVRLDPDDLLALVDALATIAPPNHEATRRTLIALLQRRETGALGIRAALTMQALGDSRGRRILFDALEDGLRRQRGEAGPYADRADAYFTFGRHKEAVRDYEQAIKFSRPGSRQAAYHLQIARCEAHRESMVRMLKALRESGVSARTIRHEAAKDDVFQAMLEKDQAQRFLDSLAR